jgi:HAE1 family hydrophobic/amphiphilic exporter-1/multidrug efflux pump
MSRYFIDRPIFAWVLAILTMLFGLLAIRGLPIAQFPALAPRRSASTRSFPRGRDHPG